MKTNVKIGTRGSPLALYQAEVLKTLLEKIFPLIPVELVVVKTGGDMVRRGGVNSLETKRIFTKEIEEALLQGEIDVAAHSAKDMGALLPEGTELVAALEREDPRDCLICRDYESFSSLPLGARIGTSSLRRKTHLLKLNPDLIIEEVHGNVGTRIKKMDDGHYDALILAYAGMIRLGLLHDVKEVFPEHKVLPAPGQGIIVAQCRTGDADMKEMLHAINHEETYRQLLCERAFTKRLEGGCQLPCGIRTKLIGKVAKLSGILLSPFEQKWTEASIEGVFETPEEAGWALAEKILSDGGREILDQIKAASRPPKT